MLSASTSMRHEIMIVLCSSAQIVRKSSRNLVQSYTKEFLGIVKYAKNWNYFLFKIQLCRFILLDFYRFLMINDSPFSTPVASSHQQAAAHSMGFSHSLSQPVTSCLVVSLSSPEQSTTTAAVILESSNYYLVR